MPAARYDIYAEQGSTFKLWMEYKIRGGTGFNLTGFQGNLQVRRAPADDKAVLYLSNSGVTHGGNTGEFTVGVDGVRGSGGITFNVASDAVTNYTGGIYISIDATSMTSTPAGKHFYDFEITNTSGEVMRLMEGAFTIPREITRTNG